MFKGQEEDLERVVPANVGNTVKKQGVGRH